jgi:hypothetical protein
MAWTLTAEELVAAVAAARAGVEERPSWGRIELLARGLRRLNEPDESFRLF